MNDTIAHFDKMPWTELARGARERRVRAGDSICRLLELSQGFEELDWCQKQHAGYVIDGEFSIAFRDRVVRYQQGDGICITAGVESEHKAIVSDSVTLFLVEPDGGA